MDKNAIKKYAVWARRELIERVSQRAMIYGITAKDAGDPDADNVNGHLLTQTEKRQRQALIRNIQQKGYEQVMEEVAYTWFNRFAALRFMEVNGYLPSHIRVFTNDEGEFKPQILAEAIHLELDGLDMNKVYELESANKSEELFKYLLIVQCNALNGILQRMFQKLDDYTVLLLPDYLLREGSVIEQMVTTIPEADWTDQVQIIGWLYQYYNTEPKDKVFADLKKNIKITKENIPAATQLFTPDWIVHYMVENSLGRLWLEGHPNDALKSEWKYYLDEAEQKAEVQAQLEIIRKEYAALKPEEIRVIDPCMGSGHILCVLFDVLVRIYEDYGYTAREAAVKIVENNLWGLDIDERAAQLAYFSVMMKARQYDRRFFTRKVQPHVYAILESNNLDPDCIEYFVDGREELKSAMNMLVKELHDAKEYGSILNVTPVDFDALYSRFEEIQNETMPGIYSYHALDTLMPFMQVAQTMAQKYHAVVTNPPYMGSSGMSAKLSDFVRKKYPYSKNDLFAVFIERAVRFSHIIGFISLITQYVWMYKTVYKDFRKSMLDKQIINMAHLGPGAFDEISGEVVNTVAFVMTPKVTSNYISTFIKLLQYPNEESKRIGYLKKEDLFYTDQSRFKFVSEHIYAYWVSGTVFNILTNMPTVDDVAAARKGLTTGDNDRFVRLWHEVSVDRFTITNGYAKWYPMTKGGSFRKWFGNNEYVIDWENNGHALKYFVDGNGKMRSVLRNTQYYLKECISWNDTASGDLAFRYQSDKFIPNASGPCVYSGNVDIIYLLGLFNSKVSRAFMQILAPALKFEVGQVARFPVVYKKEQKELITSLVKKCVSLSKIDWDSFETSWGFKCHPLVVPALNLGYRRLSDCWKEWERACDERFGQLKTNEDELNRIFIEIYGLQDELTPEVEDKDVTVRRADLSRDIRSFISYIVGCMFGRYSIDAFGLAYAGGAWNSSKYKTFQPDKDAILPICDDEYFEDDIVGLFVKFVNTVYGKATLEENLCFIADALGGKGSSREVIRNYFINDFYADHLKVYQKRPIYWLFDSGKKNGFKCLVYMHRYQPDTIARIRTDYVHEQQSRYRTAIADLEQRISSASSSERVKLNKQLATLQAQAEEILIYEEKIHHLADQMIKIDLDDGVKHNYSIFKDVLAKI